MKKPEVQTEKTKAMMDARQDMIKCLTDHNLTFHEGACLFGIISGVAIVSDCKHSKQNIREARKQVTAMFDKSMRDTMNEVQKEEWLRGAPDVT